PANTHFDEVGMYNYITTIHDFFKTLGHSKLDRPMKAIVHLGDKYDNAYFSPWENKMAFGDGDKFNVLSREAGVAYHEYSHAMLNSIKSLTYSGESGAINEGQADYFACTVTNDPLLGEWAVAKMNKPYLRILENDLEYPKDIQGEVHADGKIWGAVLWDLRKALGKDVSDVIIYRSLYNLKSSSAKFIDGYNAIVTADKDFFEGKNIAQIDKVFAKRGIIASNYNGAVLTAEDLKEIRLFNEAHNE
ncbi:MAG: M36 family metallopeptidase, partial [Candidatus Riflebacteria bacterium]|nr:M36 family metallopeptidase [Candidatus Riflebacteria bacterium]